MAANNDEDRDVKEQMAARYQERVSMGYTRSGTGQQAASTTRHAGDDLFTLLDAAGLGMSTQNETHESLHNLSNHNIVGGQSSSHNNTCGDSFDNALDQRNTARQEETTESRKAMMKELIERFELDRPSRSDLVQTSSFQSKKADSESKLVTSECSAPIAKSDICTTGDTKSRSYTTSSLSKMTTSASDRTVLHKRQPLVSGIKPAMQAKRYLLRQMGAPSQTDDSSGAAATSAAVNAMPPTRIVLRGQGRRKSPIPSTRREKFTKLLSTPREPTSEVCTPFTRAIVKKKVSMSSISSGIPHSSQTSQNTDSLKVDSLSKDKQLESQTLGDQKNAKQDKQQQPQQKEHQTQKPQSNSSVDHPTPQKRQLLKDQGEQEQQSQQQKKQETTDSKDTENRSSQPQEPPNQPEQQQQDQEPPSPLERKLVHRKIRRRSSTDNPSKKRSTTAMERYLRFLKNSSPSPSGNVSSVDTDTCSNTANLLPDSKELFPFSGDSTPCNYIQDLMESDKATKDTKIEPEHGTREKSTTSDMPTSPPSHHARNATVAESLLSEIYKENIEFEITNELSPWSPNEARRQQLRDLARQVKGGGNRSKSPRHSSGRSPRRHAKKGSKASTSRSNSLVSEKKNMPFYHKVDHTGTASNTASITKNAGTLSPKQKDDKKAKVSRLFSRYEEAKNVLQKHQLNRKVSDRRAIAFPSLDNGHADGADNILLTKDQLADTNLIPVHLRQRRFYTSPSAMSDDSQGGFFDILSGLSSSEEEDSSYLSISERLKQIKASRLRRKGRELNGEKKSPVDDSLVNLLTNFVEAMGKRTPKKRSRKSSRSPPRRYSPTADNLRCIDTSGLSSDALYSSSHKHAKTRGSPKSPQRGSPNGQRSWDSTEFKLNNVIAENMPSLSPRGTPKSNQSRHSHKSGHTTTADYRSAIGKPNTSIYCDAVSEQIAEATSLYSSCHSTKRTSTSDKLAEVCEMTPDLLSRPRVCHSHSSHSQNEDSRFLLDEDFLMLLEENPALTSSGSSVEQVFIRADDASRSPGTKGHFVKGKRKAEKKDKAKRKAKRKIAIEEAKAKSARKMSREISDVPSRTVYLKRGVSPRKFAGSKAEVENKESIAPFVRQDSKIPCRPKSKTDNKSPTRLPLRQVKSNIYPKNHDSNMTTGVRGKEDKSATKVSPLKKTISSKGMLYSPSVVRTSRNNSPVSRLRYQDPEPGEIGYRQRVMPIFPRTPRPSTQPTKRWPTKSRIPLLVTIPKKHREGKEVLVQYRRSLKTGIALTDSFKNKLKAAAHEEWSMHEWTMPPHSGDESDMCIMDDDDTISCDLKTTECPREKATPAGIPIKRRLNRLHGICLGVWLTMAGIVHLGTQLYSCNGDDYDYFCKNDDLQCLLPPVY